MARVKLVLANGVTVVGTPPPVVVMPEDRYYLPESVYRDHLARQVGGLTEVCMPGHAYRLDVCKANRFYEVKKAAHAALAIEKVHSEYELAMTGVRGAVALFRRAVPQDIDFICDLGRRLDVPVIWFDGDEWVPTRTAEQRLTLTSKLDGPLYDRERFGPTEEAHWRRKFNDACDPAPAELLLSCWWAMSRSELSRLVFDVIDRGCWMAHEVRAPRAVGYGASDSFGSWFRKCSDNDGDLYALTHALPSEDYLRFEKRRRECPLNHRSALLKCRGLESLVPEAWAAAQRYLTQ